MPTQIHPFAVLVAIRAKVRTDDIECIALIDAVTGMFVTIYLWFGLRAIKINLRFVAGFVVVMALLWTIL